MTLDFARQRAIELLENWDTSSMEGRWHLVDQSEAIEQNLLESGVLRRDGMDVGPAAIVEAAYDIIASAHHQRFLPEDVPVVLELLRSDAGKENSALRMFDEYWERVDFEARERPAQRFWFDQDAA